MVRSSASGRQARRSSSGRAKGERELVRSIADHGEAVQLCLDQLTDPEIGVLHDAGEVAAIGFKAVHARGLTGVHLVDDAVLAAMEAFAAGGSGPQSAVHQSDAHAARPLPGPAAGRRV